MAATLPVGGADPARIAGTSTVTDATPVTTVELVRHAQAHRRDRWAGRPDRERPLTGRGLAQARGLAEELAAGPPITLLASSPYARCVQTLEPLADACGQAVEEVEALGEAVTLPVHDGGDAWVAAAWIAGRASGYLDRAVAAHPGSRLVLCTHGDVIPALLAYLVGRDGLDRADLRCKKGARFVLVFTDSACTSLSYHPPAG